MENFEIAGVSMSLANSSTCVIYDAASGRIYHVHTVATFADSRQRSREEIEKESYELASRAGHNVAAMKALHIGDENMEPDVRYKVNLSNMSLTRDSEAN